MKARKLLSAVAVVALLMAFSAWPALAAERIVKLSVWGMHCAKDELVVGGMLDGIEGVEDYTIDIDEETAVVAFDDELTSLEDIRGVIDSGVYAVEDVTYPCGG